MRYQSAIYVGQVRHRRLRPVTHAFRYGLFMMYVDLAELPDLFRGRWFWSARRPAPAWFRRQDYLGPTDRPLDRAVRDLVRERLGREVQGPIRLLTHLRYFGYIQNPVSFYYCFDPSGTRVEAIVAEITNTPWGERHRYVLGAEANVGGRRTSRFRFKKAFHVSPFMDMDLDYDWIFTPPGEKLSVHMESHERGVKLFDATLRLMRREITGPALARVLARYPWMTARVVAGIYWQAFRLWRKRCPFFAHPTKRGTDTRSLTHE
jgi:DUF1365 family protein